MKLASLPLKKESNARQRHTIQITSSSDVNKSKEKDAEKIKNWETEDVLASPFEDEEELKDDLKDDLKVSGNSNNRHTVSFEPKQLKKLESFEKIRKSQKIEKLPSNKKMEIPRRESHSSEMTVKNQAISFQVDFCHNVVYANQTIFINFTVKNSVKNALIEG
jgi:hypothetical protein